MLDLCGHLHAADAGATGGMDMQPLSW
jgi:hypothetical protein